MLYIFHVETGATITFNIGLALQSVAELKEAIERECGVLADHQVLLMSGGESLEPNARVCSYSAGTDTNPIYLFNQGAIESQVPPVPHTDYSTDVDLADQINASLAMPATYATLVARAQLAQQCFGIARDQTRTCEHLVHDQHLQQQGWAAVVANLEDITQMFQSRADLLQQSVAHYLTEREQHMQLLNNFSGDLQTLAKIPILPALRAQADGLLSPEELQTQNPSCESSPDDQHLSEVVTTGGNDEVLSLLRWISAKDNQSSLEQIFEQCSRGLEQFDERMMEALKSEVNAAIDASNMPELKEIKGLGERLFGLEQLMTQAKRLVQDQGELAQGFSQNQTRANNLGDPSVLPDLCASHRKQLIVMMENHNQLRDIRRRCTRAKEELSENIYHRLKWIMFVEKKIWEVDGKLVMYHENLKRLKRHLEILQQIHLAPQMYVSAVSEVVRRRTFSQAFLLWASNLACQLMTIHSEEMQRRREFQGKFDGHFLNILFPGLEDTPPPFATEAPTIFDNGLPKLTPEDMDLLKCQLPDFIGFIMTPDLNSITQFFLSKSLSETNSGNGIGGGGGGNAAAAAAAAAGGGGGGSDGDGGYNDERSNKNSSSYSSNTDEKKKKKKNRKQFDGSKVNTEDPCINDRLGFESETDTDEFEKISQAVLDQKQQKYQQSYWKTQKSLTKDLEENLVNTRAQVKRLRAILQAVKSAMGETMNIFRNELTLLRDQVNDDKNREIHDVIKRVRQALVLHSQECERVLREREQELTVDHELELADAKKLLEARNDEIENLKRTIMEKENEEAEQQRLISTMRQQLKTEQDAINNLQSRFQGQLNETLEQARIDKETCIKQATEISLLTSNLEEYRRNIRGLEENLTIARTDHHKLLKEATDKLQMEYKTELETIRGRFKLMAASTVMERSPSDSSLEKIERPDLIELANHEAILAQTKEDFQTEKDTAIREAIEKESQDFEVKLQFRLGQMKQQIESHMLRENELVEECQQYRESIRRLRAEDSRTRQTLTEQVEKLEEEKHRLEQKISVERIDLRHDNKIGKNLKMSLSEAEEDSLKSILASGKDDIQVSESKKVRLESSDGEDCLSRKLEILGIDNKRLSTELRATRESKENMAGRIEALEAEKVYLEIELVKERSRQNYQPEVVIATIDSRDKEMNSSVAIVSETSSSQETGSCTDVNRQDLTFRYREKLIKSTTNLFQQLSISLNSCNTGDSVIVLWDTTYSNYIVLQESRTMYFLHSDCVETLDLRPSLEGLPRQTYVLGEVIDKQYCHAKKPENRYKVPQGTKFYRVRVKPLHRDLDLTASLADRSHQ